MHKLQINLNQSKDLTIIPDILNLTEEKSGSDLEHMVKGDIVLNRTLIAQELRSRIHKGDLMKLRSV